MFTTYAKNQIINNIVGNASSAFNNTCYLALSTTEPNVDGTNVSEPSGNGYARVLIGNSATHMMGTSTTGESKNTKEIHFNEVTGTWGTCAYGCLYDAETQGHLIAFFELTEPISPVVNTVPIVRPNDLTITFSEE